jgi:hypothetical protein
LAAASSRSEIVEPDGSLGPWQLIGSINSARYLLAATESAGYIYVVGGHGYGGAYFNSVERAAVQPDGTVGPWQFTAPMNTEREGLTVATYRGHLYALGGYNGSINVNTVEQAAINSDGTLNSWTVMPSMTLARVYPAAFAAENHLFAVGGYSPSGGIQNSVERAELNPPVLFSFTPTAVSSDSETTVTVYGTNILPSPSLYLGDSLFLESGHISTNTVTATIPSGLANGWYTTTLTSGDGRVAILSNAMRADGPGPVTVGDYGVTINNGALFTNQIMVTLTIGSREDTAQMQISNDGGFSGAQWETYASHRAWQITQYGSYVLPRTVYIRYRDLNGNTSAAFQDDIILDVTPPEGGIEVITGVANTQVLAIQTSGQLFVSNSTSGNLIYLPLITSSCSSCLLVNLRLCATDDVSGVGDMIISNDAEFFGAHWEPYATWKEWLSLDAGTTAIYAKFRDNAGNESVTYTATLSP